MDLGGKDFTGLVKMRQKDKFFVSWSGGKDSYLSLIKTREAGMNVGSLVTFVNNDGWSMSHGLPQTVLQKQAALLGIPLVTEPVTWGEYEKGFYKVVGELKSRGFKGGVFGDINLSEHRHWVENACERAGISCFLPLWGMEEEEVLAELLRRKAELLVVALRSDLLHPGWIGRLLDNHFIDGLREKGVSPCGERGEYHTLAVYGPFFKERLEVSWRGYKQKDNVIFLNYLCL